MDFKERFSIFDEQIANMPGLSPEVKNDFKQLARAVVESMTGTPVDELDSPAEPTVSGSPDEGTIDVAQYVGLDEFIQAVNSSVKGGSNATFMSPTIIDDANEICQRIEDITNEIEKTGLNVDLDTSSALKMVDSFPDTSARMSQIKVELAKLRNKHVGFTDDMSDEEFSKLEKEIRKYNTELRNLKNINTPFARIKNALGRLNQTINDITFREANRRVSEKQMQWQKDAQSLKDSSTPKKVVGAETSGGTGGAGLVNPPKPVETKSAPVEIDPETAEMQRIRAQILAMSKSNGTINIIEFLPSLPEAMQTLEGFTSGEVNADALSKACSDLKLEMEKFLTAVDKLMVGSAERNDVLKIDTSELQETIGVNEIDEELAGYDETLNGWKSELETNYAEQNDIVNRLNEIKEQAHGLNKMSLWNNNPEVNELIARKEELIAANREISSKINEFAPVKDALNTFKDIIKACDRLGRTQKGIEQFNDSLPKPMQPAELFDDLQAKLNGIVSVTEANKNDIYCLMLAIQQHNKMVRSGYVSSVGKMLKKILKDKGLKLINTRRFTTAPDGSVLFRVNESVLLPLRVAYEMSMNGVSSMVSNDNDMLSFVIMENMTHGDRILQDWNITFDMSRDPNKIDIVASNNNPAMNSPESAEPVSVDNAIDVTNKVLGEGFNQLGSVVAKIKPMPSTVRH